MWTLISKLARHWSDPPCHHPDTGHPSQHHWAEEQTHDTAELPRLEGKHLAFWLIGYISYVRVSIICERHSRDDMRLFIQYPSTCITDALMRRCIESPKDSIKVNVTARHCRHCTRYKSEIWKVFTVNTNLTVVLCCSGCGSSHLLLHILHSHSQGSDNTKSWIHCYSYMLYVFNSASKSSIRSKSEGS